MNYGKFFALYGFKIKFIDIFRNLKNVIGSPSKSNTMQPQPGSLYCCFIA